MLRKIILSAEGVSKDGFSQLDSNLGYSNNDLASTKTSSNIAWVNLPVWVF
jgi:hypothetical protein